MHVFILHSAEDDLKELRAYILSQFSKVQWLSTSSHIRQALTMLADTPLAGNVPNELEELGSAQYRQLICGKNRIIYELCPPDIFIHIIVDSRMDLRTLLTKRLLRIKPQP